MCLSDTHGWNHAIAVPPGDVLVHAGDLTQIGTEEQVKKALAWLEELPFQHKLLVPGNHDWFFDPNAPKRFRDRSLYRYYTTAQMMAKAPSVTLLVDQEIVINGVKFYGSPWQPFYYGWGFNLKPTHEQYVRSVDDHTFSPHRPDARDIWAKIPVDVNVLITHGPPEGILDDANDEDKTGCPELRRRLNCLERLRLHVFGHIHEAHGRVDFRADDGSGDVVTFVNAAICDLDYKPTQAPIVVDI